MSAALRIAGALALLAGTPAMAQQVTVYGLVDTSLAYVTNVNAQGESVVRMPALTGSLPSRVGLRGSEDLGGGVQALFVLETGILLDSGGLNQGNRMFGRAAHVGLQGRWGSLTLGRQPNMSFYGYLKSDIMGPSLFSLSALDSYLPNARSDNALGYLGKFGGVTLGATWSLGRDASTSGGPAGTSCPGERADDSRACRQKTAMLAYDSASGSYGVSAVHDMLDGGPGAGGGLDSSDYGVRRVSLNGYVRSGDVKLGGGIIRRTSQTALRVRTDFGFVGLAWTLRPWLVWDTQYVDVDVDGSEDGARLLATRLTWHLSKRTALYAMAGRVDNAGNAALPVDAGGTVGPGMGQTGVAAGMRLAF